MTVADLRQRLAQLHARAEAALAPGIDYVTWYERHWAPLVSLRVDALCEAACAREGKSKAAWDAEQREHARLCREFRPSEERLDRLAQLAAESKPAPKPREIRARALPRTRPQPAPAYAGDFI